MSNLFSETHFRLAAVNKGLPRKAGAMIVEFFKESFRQQGWWDRNKEKWAARKSRKRQNKGRAILVKSGRLRRSIRVIQVVQSKVIVGTDVPYARIHNEGGEYSSTDNVSSHTRKAHGRKGYTTRAGRKVKRGTVREHTVKAHSRTRKVSMPKRQFMGSSAALEKRLYGLVSREVYSALKPR